MNTTAHWPQFQLQCFFSLGFYMKPKNSHTKHWSIVSDRDRRCLSANGAIAVYICEMYICEMNSDWIICATHLTLHMCTLAQQTHTSLTSTHSLVWRPCLSVRGRSQSLAVISWCTAGEQLIPSLLSQTDGIHIYCHCLVFIDTQTQIGRGDFTLQWKHCHLKLQICCRHDSNTFIYTTV